VARNDQVDGLIFEVGVTPLLLDLRLRIMDV